MRDAALTRRRILEAAFAEIHARGFHSASVEDILRKADVTKGALYHHFASKDALGHAVVSELIQDRIAALAATLREAPDPAAALVAWLEAPPPTPLRLGCPLNNLAQELSAVDEEFRIRIEAVFGAWRRALADALARGQRMGLLHPSFDPTAVAAFLLAALEGSISLAKSAGDARLFRSNLQILVSYVDGLRSRSSRSRARRRRSPARGAISSSIKKRNRE